VLGVGSALDGGDPRLAGFFAGLLLRVVDPEGAEGFEVEILGGLVCLSRRRRRVF
jgi:hypothetical protein